MRTVKLKDLAASIERRKVQLGISGYDYVMPNSGQNGLCRFVSATTRSPTRSSTLPSDGIFTLPRAADVPARRLRDNLEG